MSSANYSNGMFTSFFRWIIISHARKSVRTYRVPPSVCPPYRFNGSPPRRRNRAEEELRNPIPSVNEMSVATIVGVVVITTLRRTTGGSTVSYVSRDEKREFSWAVIVLRESKPPPPRKDRWRFAFQFLPRT